jgi:ferrochelatase
LSAAVICPIGFVCDHNEVRYDLDREAADICREIGLSMTRAEAVNDDPRFIELMAQVVAQTIDRYTGRPLGIVGGRK